MGTIKTTIDRWSLKGTAVLLLFFGLTHFALGGSSNFLVSASARANGTPGSVALAAAAFPVSAPPTLTRFWGTFPKRGPVQAGNNVLIGRLILRRARGGRMSIAIREMRKKSWTLCTVCQHHAVCLAQLCDSANRK